MPDGVPCETTLCDEYGGGRFPVSISNDNAANFITSTFNGSSTVLGQNILLDGFILIDVPITFVNCNFKISGNTVIIVQAGGVLTFDGSRLFSCTELWKGIELLNGSDLRCINGTEIEDAARAVEILRYTTAMPLLTITNTTFNRNYVDLYAHFETDENGANFTTPLPLDFSRFRENFLTCTCDLLPNSLPGIVPANAIRTYAGIEWHLVSAGVLGLPYESFCGYFEGLGAGIRLDRSTLRVRGGCVFHGMINSGNLYSPYTLASGWGIIGIQSSDIRVGQDQPCTFTDNQAGGVLSYRSQLTAAHNYFAGNRAGAIESYANFGAERVQIVDNTVNLYQDNLRAFVVDRTAIGAPALRDLIIDNEINRLGNSTATWIDPLELVAINLLCRNAGATDLVYIRNNEYNDYTGDNLGFPGDIGIYLVPTFGADPAKGNNIRVINNEVTYLGTNINSQKTGIYMNNLNGSTGIEINNNDLIQTQPPSKASFSVGLQMDNTQTVNICDNLTQNLTGGMYFRFNNGASNLVTNVFNDYAFRGLLIEAGGLGTQLRRDNQWSPPVSSLALAADAGSLNNSILTPYFVSNAADPVLNPPNINPPFGWFSTGLQGAPNLNCGPVSDGGGGGGTPVGITLHDQALMDGQIQQMTGITDVRLWSHRSEFVGKLLRNPSIPANNVQANNFIFQYLNAPEGRFAQLGWMLEQTETALNSQYAPALGQSITAFDSLLTLVDLADSMIYQASGGSAWVAQRAIWTDQATTVQDQLSDLNTQVETDRLSDWAAVLNFNAATTTNLQHEAWLKSVYHIWLNAEVNQGGVFNASDISLLTTIAAQDPVTGGQGVAMARQLLPVDCPDAAQRGNASTGDNTDTSGLKVWPVPASDWLTVEYPEAMSGSWKISDMSGRTLRDGSFTPAGRQDLISLKGLTPGLYFLSFTTQEGAACARKIVVAR